MREDVEEAAHQRAGVVAVLGRQRQPLGDDAARLQAAGGQLVELARVEVDHAAGRRRWRLQRDEVVALRALQQFAPAVAQADVDALVVAGVEIAPEAGRGAHHGGHQFRHHTVFQARILEQRAGRDAGAEPDHQCRARRAVVDDQRQQRLEAHVAQRRHGIARVRHPLVYRAGGSSACPWTVRPRPPWRPGFPRRTPVRRRAPAPAGGPDGPRAWPRPTSA